MALLTKSQAQQQLATEVKWWRKNFSDKEACRTRPGWGSPVGNKPSDADSIKASDYNSIANQWCGVNTNTHKKRSEKTNKDGYKIFKEADSSLSGGKGTCHFIESWSDGNKFNWHLKVVSS